MSGPASAKTRGVRVRMRVRMRVRQWRKWLRDQVGRHARVGDARRLAVLLTAPLLTGCSVGLSGPDTVALGEEFTLAVHERAVVDDALVVEFMEVPSDSRCPVEANCVWAGNAVVVVETVLDGVEQVVTLNTLESATTGPAAVAVGRYQLRLLELAPEATVDGIPQGRYRATFVATTGLD